ncbi:hypothetical protein Pst134EA_019601 [Puccinia striiformis f. sp. tritici]|uniref:Uncharacterized protein n=3 Tax=Puccinia striiformis TaxID=27350 RepID=A0A0L0W1K8_9BASI|nr:hypothetical protein Pst134EA_019601 [Puccinia striiformis f. sp. tritici]KAI9618666.1 hypothetical protein KEM48_006645 [Puccinia striiformis f. sp. tritici PST-130]KNF05357.1 hypothetical protein PSTG_01572 [Puccinia striiformis f. sp. tritici PST-78]POW08853.1 hypothetical protein PSHT_09382 [Puccinia striiformis]KAH9449682.1 hypothetical protein Pst134EB_020500 [Puccinia striiformis f. sp. tritici]KAH9459447.1 hypothetical protein Pst134EA_019601 [Puccinia striiformis f. sp. tritici]
MEGSWLGGVSQLGGKHLDTFKSLPPRLSVMQFEPLNRSEINQVPPRGSEATSEDPMGERVDVAHVAHEHLLRRSRFVTPRRAKVKEKKSPAEQMEKIRRRACFWVAAVSFSSSYGLAVIASVTMPP